MILLRDVDVVDHDPGAGLCQGRATAAPIPVLVPVTRALWPANKGGVETWFVMVAP